MLHKTFNSETRHNNKISAFARLLISNRSLVYPDLLVQAVQEGWLTKPHELVEQGSILLAYLSTYNHLSASRETIISEDLLSRVYYTDVTKAQVKPSLVLAQMLLDAGTDPWAQDPEGRDCMDQLFSLQWIPLMDVILDHPNAVSKESLTERTFNKLPWIHYAVKNGNLGMVQHLVKHYGFSVNQLDSQGRSPLFYAQNKEMTEWLIAQKSDLSIVDEDGNSINSYWSSNIVTNTLLGELTKILGKAFETLDPEVVLKLQKPVLYQIAARGNKDNFLKFLRANPFNVDDTLLIKGRSVSLMAFTAMSDLYKDNSKQSILRHIILHSKNHTHETIPGVPDILIAAISMDHSHLESYAEQFLPTVEEKLEAYYHINTPEGFLHYMQDHITVAQYISNSAKVKSPDKVLKISEMLFGNFDRTPYHKVTRKVFEHPRLFITPEPIIPQLLDVLTDVFLLPQIDNLSGYYLGQIVTRGTNILEKYNMIQPEIFPSVIALMAYVNKLDQNRAPKLRHIFDQLMSSHTAFPAMTPDLQLRLNLLQKKQPSVYASLESMLIASPTYSDIPKPSMRKRM